MQIFQEPDEHYVRLLQEVDSLTQGASIPRTGLNQPSLEDRLMMSSPTPYNPYSPHPHNQTHPQISQPVRRIVQNAPLYDYSKESAAKPATRHVKTKSILKLLRAWLFYVF